MKGLIFIVCIFLFAEAYTQNKFQAFIKDGHTKEPLIGTSALLEGTSNGAVADLEGLVTITNIPNGKQLINFSYVGYEIRKDSFYFPLTSMQPLTVYLEKGEELEEVIVYTTRRSRTIEDTPTRMEAITGEELGEKAVMNSTNLAMLLRESTGIQMQQTSANPERRISSFWGVFRGTKHYADTSSRYNSD